VVLGLPFLSLVFLYLLSLPPEEDVLPPLKPCWMVCGYIFKDIHSKKTYLKELRSDPLLLQLCLTLLRKG